MIPLIKIAIDQEAPGLYVARAHIGWELIGVDSINPNIEAAIRDEARRADGEACFIAFSYCGVSTGTLWCEEAQTDACR